MGDAEAGRLLLKAPLAAVALAGGEADGRIGCLVRVWEEGFLMDTGVTKIGEVEEVSG